MGRHVDEFLAAQREGRIIGDKAVAWAAEQAVMADKAERQAGRRHAAARHAADPDGDVYDALFPSQAEGERRRDAAILAAHADAASLTDDDLYARLFAAP